MYKIAKNQEDYIIKIRRQLHQYPELSWKENNTLKLIKKEIASILKNKTAQIKSYSVKNTKGGIWVDININKKLDRLLFRADIDALPIQEKTKLSFESKNKNVSHGCGHDVHTAMLLGALRAIVTDPKCTVLKHNLRFVFQRAEEYPNKKGMQGAEEIIKENVLQGVNEVYALHTAFSKKPGTFYSKPGPAMASSDEIEIKIETSGGHAAMPERGQSALKLAIKIIEESEKYCRKNDKVVFEPTIFNSGDVANIIPSKSTITYSLRTFLVELELKKFLKKFESKVKNIDKTAKIIFNRNYPSPSLINTDKYYKKSRAILLKAKLKLEKDKKMFVSDDFAYYLQKCPGTYWALDVWQKNSGPHHSPNFNPDEKIFWKGVLFWVLLATN